MNNGFLKTKAVLLAAGFSSRMGKCKALLDIEGTSALRRASLSMHLAGVGDLVVGLYLLLVIFCLPHHLSGAKCATSPAFVPCKTYVNTLRRGS